MADVTAADAVHTELWKENSMATHTIERPVTRPAADLETLFPGRFLSVTSFKRDGTGAGYRSDGEPGPRPEYGDHYYGGFLLDPDGISAEAVHNDSLREGGAVDHLWIRVADVPASKAFYERIGAAAGFQLQADMPLRAQFMGESGSFSVLAGAPTRNVELGFRTHGDASEHVDPEGNRVVLTNDGSRPVPLT